MRPSSFKAGGGGFLNNVDGKISDYEFTDVFPGGKGKGKKPKSDFHSLYMVLTIIVDGKEDAPETTTLWAGDADAVEISDDGKTLTPSEGNDTVIIGETSDVGIFLKSMTDHGFDESEFDEDEAVANFEPIINQRVRFVQQTNVEKTKKLGKRKGKDGKEYNRQDLVVSEVYGPAEEEAPAKGKKSSKAAPAAKGAKGKKEVEEADYSEAATEVLLAVLAASGGEIAVAKLNTPALRAMLKLKTEDKDDVLALLKTAEFLGTEDGWTFNTKKGLINVVE